MDSLAEPRWPPGLAVMKTIDDLLRCGICFEYFNIAMMIPQCSHNYCSLCIRKFLSYKTQCPTCCVTVTEPDLKNNRILDELVKGLNFARNHVLQFALESPPISPASSSSKKPAARVDPPGGARQPQKQGTRLLDNFLIKETGASAPPPLARDKESKFSPRKEAQAAAKGKESADRAVPASSATAGPETPSTSTPNPSPRVDCPVCGVSIPENHINKHLDCCLSRGEKKESLRSSANKRKPLPKTVYNLLSDRELRRKLKQHGLSVHGTKQQLIKRHQEFVHMYNAQCDSLHPKSAAEIVQEIENMERTRMRLEASRLSESIMVFTKHQTEKEIDEIHSKYRKKHHNEFQLLVDQAKKGYKKAGEVAPKKVAKKEEACAERPSPMCPGPEEKMRASVGPLVASRLPRAQRASSGSSEPERADDDSASCSDPREASPSSPESDSCNSSSSDIIRDLLEQEEAWEAAHRNEVPDTEWAPRHTRRARASDGAETEPRNKRNRN
ncbi:E3 ubiquitin-protein ligase RAD18 [Sorex fumeus]|uniref:E3 ubiquitin-protein ligase RAD18 n=1 Tax=Sorex fumeus TaxID=62283 RepID=UPI0024ADE763|nr:E3 ubiquitin-protein ligase RAD18 [Sorex fumeus]